MNIRNAVKTVALLTLCLFLFSDASHARKWSFSTSSSNKKPRLMRHFITNTNNVKYARPVSRRIRRGQKIYFYYKIGPVKVTRGRGAPYRTRLVIRRGSRLVKDFGWHSANAAPAGKRNRNGTYKWFHNAKWYLKTSHTTRPGRYTAIISHRDRNTGKLLTIRYSFNIVR